MWNLDYFEQLTLDLREEEKEQKHRYRLDQPDSLKILKREGLVIHPLKVVNKTFGFADYPEVHLHSNFPMEAQYFRDSASIELFIDQQEPVKGIVIQNEGNKLWVRLFAPDFPEWLEEPGLGLKLSPDEKTLGFMKKALENVPNWLPNFQREKIEATPKFQGESSLNSSQEEAITHFHDTEKQIAIIHGPPGTGKSTTLVEGILRAVHSGKRVLVTAPSNAAVNHLTRLLKGKVNQIRVGNLTKIDDDLTDFTLEGKWKNSKDAQTIKKWKIQAEELRKMSHQYKRNFGKDDRNQRNLLRQEVQRIRKDIRDFARQIEQKWMTDAQVVLGTPVAISDLQLDYFSFDFLVIDEASQLLEPLFWGIVPFAKKIVLAGDPFQLPPTLLSSKVQQSELGISILERLFNQKEKGVLLQIQYRMPPELIAFSNQEFYEGQLQSHLPSNPDCLKFYDTAGTDAEETQGESGSLCNPKEIEFILNLIQQEGLTKDKTSIISPYSAQVDLLRKELKGWHVSTIDSFQGQENECILFSMVRSNNDGNLGFLKDYRRMNVGLTRAKSKLFVFGDSATLGSDAFFARFLDLAEKNDQYRSCWELFPA